MRWRLVAVALLCATAGCAGPPLTLYTLAPDPPAGPAWPVPRTVVAVSRVAVPDAFDTQDMLVRDGATLKRSAASRWAERLSLGITDLVTAQLAVQMPRALVTDQPQAGLVTTRLAINISRLDVQAGGTVTLAADWTWTPSDTARPIGRARTLVTMNAPTNTDAAMVAALRSAVVVLAARVGATEM